MRSSTGVPVRLFIGHWLPGGWIPRIELGVLEGEPQIGRNGSDRETLHYIGVSQAKPGDHYPTEGGDRHGAAHHEKRPGHHPS